MGLSWEPQTLDPKGSAHISKVGKKKNTNLRGSNQKLAMQLTEQIHHWGSQEGTKPRSRL